MTKETMRVRVVEAMGWTPLKSNTSKSFTCAWQSPEGLLLFAPDYPESLDACAEFEDEMKRTFSGTEYCMELRRIVVRDAANHVFPKGEPLCDIYFYGATPIQRCEAFLRVKGLWKEGE